MPENKTQNPEQNQEQKNKPPKDTQSRAYCFTINNYLDKDFPPEKCEKVLQSIPSLQYYIFSLEKGLEKNTPHLQGYFHCKNPIKFSTLRNKFKDINPHFEKAQGTAQENRDYVLKEGKWADNEKAHTNSGEFYEWGTMPKPHKGKRTDLSILYNMIVEGMTNAEILKANPEFLKFINHIDRTRQAIREEEYRNKWRDISCIYVYGETETNKTRTYMENYGYEHVFRITNYHNVWDGYRGQDVIIFEEFRSQIPISELLVWLEGYPNCSLRARYADKVAMYTKVVLISNIALEEQYVNVQETSPATWRAFLRRIQKVMHHKSKTEIVTYNSVEEYFHRDENFHPVPASETPFADTPEQLKLPISDDKMPFDD